MKRAHEDVEGEKKEWKDGIVKPFVERGHEIVEEMTKKQADKLGLSVDAYKEQQPLKEKQAIALKATMVAQRESARAAHTQVDEIRQRRMAEKPEPETAYEKLILHYKGNNNNDLRRDLRSCFEKKENEEALNGDGHSLYNLKFFTSRTPEAWHGAIENLVQKHDMDKGGGLNYVDPNDPIVTGIWGLDFHYFVMNLANDVLKSGVDTGGKIGRGSRAKAIAKSVRLVAGVGVF